MADDPQAQSAGSADQQAPMPSAEEQQAPQREEVATEMTSPQGEGQPDKEPALPEGVKERTSQQFEKLKKEMAAERERRLKLENALREQQITGQKPKEQDSKLPDWYNPETQEVDVPSLNSYMKQLEERAERAERAAQGVVSQNTVTQEREAFNSHPELDPNSDNFDEDFHSVVRGYLTDAMLAGRQVTFKEAADKIKSIGFGRAEKQAEKAKEEGAKEAVERLTPKEEASLAATGRPDRRAQVDNQDLSERTRYGDEDAIVARLKNIPPVGK